MSTETNKDTVRQLTEALNQGNFAIVDEVHAANYSDHSAPPGVAPGPEGVKQFNAMLRSAFPDSQTTIEDMIAEGDKIVVRWRGKGTHQSAFMGIPPTSKQVTVTGSDIYRLSDGRIVEHWTDWDTLGMLQQLGAIPTPEQPA